MHHILTTSQLISKVTQNKNYCLIKIEIETCVNNIKSIKFLNTNDEDFSSFLISNLNFIIVFFFQIFQFSSIFISI